MPVRMKDIARDLNVSVVTVSKVLRNHGDIGPATRARVLKRVKELGYQPNWAARSLATGRSYMLGLVVPTMIHPFFAEVAKGVSGKIRRKGYTLLISLSEENPGLEDREIEHLVARQVDALIIASAQSTVRSFRHIEARKVPYVLIDRKFSELNANYVGVDDAAIGALATEHLFEQGCRRIAHVRGPELSTGIGRLEGYQRVLARHGLEFNPAYVVPGFLYDEGGESSGYTAMRKLLGVEPRPDGVFCFNDPIAAGVMKAIFEAGLRIPQDIALVGAGNIPWAGMLRVPLSSIDQGSLAIGEQAARLALRLIESKNLPRPRTLTLPVKLMARASTLRLGTSAAGNHLPVAV